MVGQAEEAYRVQGRTDPPQPRSGLVAPSEYGPFDPLSDVAHGYYIDGFAERAVEACRRWVRLTQAAADVVTTRYFFYIEAIALQELGRDREAIEVAETLLRDIDDALEPVWRAKALAVIAEASARMGQHGRAMAAMAEADWLIRAIPAGSYGHLSASMAVALALRSVNLLEEADSALSGIRVVESPSVEVLVAQELALLSAFWAASLVLIGRQAEAAVRFALSAARARRMVRLARELGNEQMVARGEVIEAYAMMHLSDAGLAAARALDARHRFDPRPELVETHLLHLILARAAADASQFAVAQEHLHELIAGAEAAGREMWAATGRWALADLHEAQVGPHPAVGLMRSVASAALARVWSEREGRFAALQDRHQLRELTAETHRMGRAVLQDPLTGLGNRRLLAQTLDLGLHHPWAVFVDVDDFKTINDTFSHAVGDEVLRMLADILRSQSRDHDVLIRYGGDEFLILPAGDEGVAQAVAERVRSAVAGWPWGSLRDGLSVTVSIGVGPALHESDDPWQAADAALSAAKRAGRNRVTTNG